jgi:hypothetical protein
MRRKQKPIGLRVMTCLIGMLLPLCAMAQQITLHGVVKDPSGETVIGAAVVEKGTTNGTVTDLNGAFSLTLPPNATVEISFIGYTTQAIPLNGRTQLQVILTEAAEMLNEVVVVGYGTMKKSDLTGAVSSLGSKRITNTPVANLGQAIQGKISGVQVIDAGQPGDNVSINPTFPL